MTRRPSRNVVDDGRERGFGGTSKKHSGASEKLALVIMRFRVPPRIQKLGNSFFVPFETLDSSVPIVLYVFSSLSLRRGK